MVNKSVTNKERKGAKESLYTVLSYNINSYEIIHPVVEQSERARYIMVTDDPELKDESGTWEIVYDDGLTGSSFDRTLQVRYNPWRYTDDDIVIKIDGSIGINKSLDNLVDRFNKGDNGASANSMYDMSLMVHPTRNCFYDEYLAWVQTRGYSAEQANAILGFLQQAEGYPVKDFKGLAQLCFWIQRRNRLNEDVNRLTYAWCKYFGDKNSQIERVDQITASYVIQKYFGMAKIMFVDQRMIQSDYMTWYAHNSNQAFNPIEPKQMTEPYWLNKRLHNVVRPQDL